jgi:outer membrane receptor protein involved in Fe transport
MKKHFLIYLFFLLSSSISAQIGSIKGQIIDATLNETIIGASVLLKGTSLGAATDVEGNFLLSRVPAGQYTLVISYIGYKTKEIPNVGVQDGKATIVNTNLEEESGKLEEVVITAQRQTQTEIAVISEIKMAQSVAVGVSADQIVKTQDSDGAQVLKRLPGISLFDDRFIMVRGLSERYNAVLLNGALTPSTEVDVKSFSFDVIPSSAIDRMLVLKTGSYELPGEFAGGIIKVFTKNAPEENFTNLSVSTAYRVGTTGERGLKYEGSTTDWLGFDNGNRKLPDDFPRTQTFQEDNVVDTRVAATRRLSRIWLPKSYTVPPDFKVSLGLGRRFDIGSTRVANLTAISYSNNRLVVEPVRNRYQRPQPDGTLEPNFSYNDDQSNQSVRIGILHNWTVRLNKDNKIEFRNLFNQLGNSQTVLRNGFEAGQGDVQNYALYYETRRIYSGQLAGKHEFGKGSSIDWIAGYANTNREEPDFRRFKTTRPSGSDDQFTVPLLSSSNSLDQNARFFSKLNETVITGAINFEQKLTRGTDENQDDDITIKAGVYLEKKNRDFSARTFVFKPTSQAFIQNPDKISDLTAQQLFNDESKIAPDLYALEEGTKTTDAYEASNDLIAGYFGAIIPFGKFTASLGARLEDNTQQLKSDNGNVNVNNPILSLFPSANLSYNFNERMLVRVAYASSINRPEFREFAPFLYYDFNNQVLVQGNDSLQTPRIYNFDIRWEYYPTPSEQISFGGFYKYFDNPIETGLQGAANSTQTWEFINADYATSYGVELEVRKNLLSITNSAFIDKLSVILNASYIYNRVNLGNVTTQPVERTMMNQSPYLVNAGFFYGDDKNRLQASLLYNIFGKRLFYVTSVGGTGEIIYPAAYEMPRNSVDLSFTKGFGEKFEIKFGVQDLLNARYRITQDTDNNNKITDTDDDVISFRRGQTISLGVQYKF